MWIKRTTIVATLALFALVLVGCEHQPRPEVAVDNRSSGGIHSVRVSAGGRSLLPVAFAEADTIRSGESSEMEWQSGGGPASDGQYTVEVDASLGGEPISFSWGYFTNGFVDLQSVHLVLTDTTLALLARENLGTAVAIIDVSTGKVLHRAWFTA